MAPTNRSLEIILGALVVGVAIFFGGLLLSGRPIAGGGEGTRVFAVFGNADGIDPGMPPEAVVLAGQQSVDQGR